MNRFLRHSMRLPLAVLAIALVVPSAGAAGETPASGAGGGAIDGAPLGTARVIGGSAVAPGRWPSVVALVRAGSGSPADRQFCGATVIAPRWVLTAAHCLYDAFLRQVEPSDIRVVAGVTDLRSERADESVVTSVFPHPDYDHAGQDAYDDIALIEVANTLDVTPVTLFRGDPEALGRAPGVIVGWGATEFTTPRRATFPDALHDAVVPLVPRAICNDPFSYAGYVAVTQLCAGFVEGGTDTCVGDSGGPLFVDTGARVEQVGIVSYGRGCAEPLFFGIYTSVSAYLSWVEELVELPVPTPPLADEGLPRMAMAPVAGPLERPLDDAAPPSAVTLPNGDGGTFAGTSDAWWLLALIGSWGGRSRHASHRSRAARSRVLAEPHGHA